MCALDVWRLRRNWCRYAVGECLHDDQAVFIVQNMCSLPLGMECNKPVKRTV